MNKSARKLFFLSLIPSLMLSSCIIRIIPNKSTDYTDEKGNTVYKYQKADERYKKENLTLDMVGKSLGYHYLPSLGERKLLVVPIQFEDSKFTQTQLDRLENVFFGESEDTGWESVSSFYNKSSYGKLNITGEMTKPLTVEQTMATFSSNYKKNNKNSKTYTDFVLDAALETLDSSMDLSEYDTDQDGYIDAVWLVYSAPYNRSDSLSPFWAYTTWETSPKTVSPSKNLKGCLYSWASIDFTVEKKYPVASLFNSQSVTNGDAHTYIHETGHMLGLDDYYSYDYDAYNKNYDTPVGGIDMMDMNIGDHDSYSKYLLGWIDPLVITEEYLKSNDYELTLNSLTDMSTNRNKAFLIPTYTDSGSRFNGTAFDEYLLVEFSTNTDLNLKDSQGKYSNGLRGYTKPGVLVYHVNSRVGRMLPDSSGNPIWDGSVYDGLPEYDSTWGKKLMYFYVYSNTRSYCYDTKISDTSSRFYRGRLISLLPATGNKTGSIAQNYSSDSSLYLSGSSFMKDENGKDSTYSEFVFDDGSKPRFGFTVKGFSSDRKQATIHFNEI